MFLVLVVRVFVSVLVSVSSFVLLFVFPYLVEIDGVENFDALQFARVLPGGDKGVFPALLFPLFGLFGLGFRGDASFRGCDFPAFGFFDANRRKLRFLRRLLFRAFLVRLLFPRDYGSNRRRGDGRRRILSSSDRFGGDILFPILFFFLFLFLFLRRDDFLLRRDGYFLCRGFVLRFWGCGFVRFQHKLLFGYFSAYFHFRQFVGWGDHVCFDR